MTRITRKRAILIGLGVLVLAALIWGFLPDPLPVQTALATRGPLQVTVEAEGETRLDRRHVVSAAVPAYARAVELEPGDPVAVGQPLVQLEPPRAAILDPRARSEAAARVESARAAQARAESAAERARTERDRLRRLQAGGAATPQAVERAEAEVTQAEAGVATARAELAGAQAALQATTGDARQPARETLRSPAAGRVLAVHHRSDGPVNPGEPLIEVGDLDRLELEVPVLSQDAVRIRPGTRVLVEQWGAETELQAVVERVEPQGFTAVSALGVEERRVPVIARFASPPEAWASLGTGYRVVARFVVWEADDVLQVPTSAVFRTADGWAVFALEAGRAVLRPVTIGREAGLVTQVVAGLEPGQTVIAHPPNELEDGARVRPVR